jgi:hypothetical protein
MTWYAPVGCPSKASPFTPQMNLGDMHRSRLWRDAVPTCHYA